MYTGRLESSDMIHFSSFSTCPTCPDPVARASLPPNGPNARIAARYVNSRKSRGAWEAACHIIGLHLFVVCARDKGHVRLSRISS